MKRTALALMIAAGFALSGSARTIYVATNGQHVAPFTNSWIAATNIQSAVDVATNGDVVLVGDGTYLLPTTINITNGITLKSLGGPRAAVLNGSGLVRGLYLDHTNARVEGFTIRSCVTTAYGTPGISRGGGIYANRAALIDSCIIFSNRVEGLGYDGGGAGYGQGAGIYATSNLTIRNCLIYANVAYGEGGNGLYDPCMGYMGPGGDGYGQGGGLYAAGQLHVENSTISSNRAVGVGGSGGAGWGSPLPGNGIADGGGVYVVSAATEFVNSIIQLNMAGDAVQNWTGGAFTYTCAAPQPDGAGNISDHPQFVTPATGNYHLASASPCIDAGRTNDVTVDRDLEDNPRIVNSSVDMGAYEHPGTAAGLRVTLYPSEAVDAGAQWRVDGGSWRSSGTYLSGLSVGIHTVTCSTVAGFLAPTDQEVSIATGRTASVNSLYVRMVPPAIGVHPVSQTNIAGASVSFRVVAGGPAPLYYQWQKDAALIPSATNSGHGISELVPSDAGGYRCVVSNAYGAVTSAVATLTVQGGIHYVRLDSPAPAHPYTNWATAATNIQDAVDAATITGSLVLVTNGVYDTGGRKAPGMLLTNRVTITNAIRVRSVNGPTVTFIHGAKDPLTTNGYAAVRCVWMTDGASLAGFTLTNGATRAFSWEADSRGGGLWCPSTNAFVSNCVFAGNSAFDGGGAYGGTLEYCTLTGNWAQANGGGAYTGMLNNCVLAGNLAKTNGGGVYGGTLNNCTLNRNSAQYGSGGGAYTGRLNNCTLASNSANYGGGACYGALNNCTLVSNSAYYGGGSYYGTLDNCTLTRNSVTGTYAGEGGGAYYGTLNNCTLVSNTAYWNGGGMYGGTLSNCALTGNSAYSGGGANYSTLTNCMLTGNSAGSSGGGSSGGTLYNCTLTGNAAGSSGGGSSGGTLNNCTLTGNSATNSGGGSSGGTLNNCIVYHNMAPGGANYSGGTFNYSCALPVPTNGTNNIADNPLLLNSAHIAANSPCVGAGRTNYSRGVDIDGEPWLVPPSMGCDEPIRPTTGALSVALAADATNAVLNYPIRFDGNIQGIPVSNLWSFGDGQFLANQTFEVSHAWAATGLYAVILRVWNDDNPGGVVATVQVRIVTGVHYVNSSNATPDPPYDSWAKAATNIQDAVDAATLPASVVLVTNGVYGTGGRPATGVSLTNRVTITNTITVRSVNGPAVTTIQGTRHPTTTNGATAVRCVWMTNGATLSGFTLTNGATRETSGADGYGGGIWCASTNEAISNCVVSGNSAYYHGGGSHYGTLDNCVLSGNLAGLRGGGSYYSALYNCTLSDNSAPEYGGGAYYGALQNCTLTGNSAYNGGGSYYGTLRNCTLTGNSAHNDGGGAYYGALTNCALIGNSATNNGGGSSGSNLRNCTLTGNSAGKDGGGAYWMSGSLYNCTLTGNSAGSSGGGAAQCTLYNCIVYFNTALSGANYSGSTLNYNCTTPAPSGGTGNITNVPRLASATYLTTDSPCIGKGRSSYASGTDIDGQAWLSPPSMGCDELYAGSITGALSVSAWAFPTNVAVGFPVQFRADISGRATASEWQWGDGTISSNQPYATHVFSSAGNYAVVVRAYNETYPLGVAATVTVQVAAQAVHYVNIANATPSSPFASWATAATNIQDAVDASSQLGALVLVSNGVYATGGRVVFGSMTNRVAITKPVTVHSVNGPSATIIQGAWHPGQTNGNTAVRCVYVGTNAVLSGFTLTNGATRTSGDEVREQSGGGAWCEASGSLSNCIISGNAAYRNGGGACYGTLQNCTLTGNAARTYGGGAYYITLANCTLLGNSAQSSGGGAYNGSLDNCTLTGNSAGSGGGAYDSMMNNCTISGNSAYSGGGACIGLLNNCTLSGNSANSGGGSYSATLGNCALLNNSATNSGGGSYYGTLNNCTLTGNSAATNGGGVFQSTLRNCALAGNAAQYGGGSYQGSLINCTLGGNRANQGGGSYSGTLTNCIVYHNQAQEGPNYSGSILGYSCATPAYSGGGNITADPRLASASHLLADSPCIGAGNRTNAAGTDIDGEAWLNPPSMGCDEVHAGAITGVLSVGIWAAPTNAAAGFPIQFRADVTGRPTGIAWQWGDGSAVASNQPFATHAFATAGTYAVVLRAFNETYPLGVAATVTVQVVAQAVHYVNIVNATPSAPFSSWATAATNIQDAVDAASQPGALILVSNGVYAAGGRVVHGGLTNRVVITNAVVVRSVNGPETTIIRGAWHPGTTNGTAAVRCAVVGNNAVLAGFTLTNGATALNIYYGDWPECDGGGAWCEVSGVLSNCVISGNSAYNNGGGASYGTLNNCTLVGNSASYGGGAYYSTLNNCTISGNSVPNTGGGTYYGALSNCTLTGNSAYSGGGSGYSILADCTLTGNVADHGGGAYYGALNNCTLTGNSGNNSGGGAYDSALSNCTLTANVATNGGGSYYGTLTDCILTGNTATNGGGSYAGTLNNCLVTNNSASRYGGGSYTGRLNNCTLAGNSANINGGGAYYGTLSNCTISGNLASAFGGGSYYGALSNCTISDNAAGSGGGVYYGSLNNCAIFGNTAATNGGGSYFGTLKNCTLTGNSAADSGGGSYYGTLQNSIAYYNTALNGPNYMGGSFNYSCATPAPGGTGNIANEPWLASASHLAIGSPCIGAGHSTNVVGTDIDGEAWQNPPSMGCDEIVAGSVTGTLSVSIWAAPTNAAMGFPIQFRANISGRTTASAWQWGDGSAIASNQPYVSHAFATAGTYAVVLRAYNETYPLGVAATVTVQVAAQAVHYVNIGNVTPSSPFTSWATAATNIQDAVDAASQPGALVLVSNGVYATGGRVVHGSMTNRVAISKPVMVRSVNGPGATIIQGARHPGATNGNAAVRCVYLGTNALLSGFTLTNGATRASGDILREQSGGGVWCEVYGAVSNCTVAGNAASSAGGGVFNGMLDNCMVAGNLVATNGGGVAYSTLNNCTLSGNSTYSNYASGGGAYYGTLNNCTISGNSANGYSSSGGGTYYGTLNNCTLTGNSATNGNGGGSSYGTLQNCRVIGNSANYGGGSYYGTLNNCAITGNSAAEGGGSYYGTRNNCAIFANSASTNGGGSYNGTLNNCTIVGNSASYTGGGTYYGTLNNCIVYFNTAGDKPNHHSSSFTFNYSCTTPAPSGGAGNITNEPVLASPSHLATHSPCIGAGSSTNTTGTDIDGEAWRNPPSMGCDEVHAGAITGALGVSIWAVPTNAAVGFPIQFRADITGRTTRSTWQWADGSAVASNQSFVAHAFVSAGTYAVVLRAYNETHPSGVAATVTVQVATQSVHYVNIGNATPSSPFTSWATAATNIQDAVDASSQVGALVLVSNGVYATGGRVVNGTLTNRVAITKPIFVRSVNGPGVTVIRGARHPGETNGDAAVRCVYVGTNAMLSGFTLTNGATRAVYEPNYDSSGGGAWCEVSGVLSNCTLVGNAAYRYGGGSSYGTLQNCSLTGNRSDYGGGSYGGTLNNCTLTGNSAYGNNSYGGGTYYATLNNCMLVGNSSYHGGGVASSTLNNCTLTNNTARYGGGANSGTLNNCTLAGNLSSNFGGGSYYGTLSSCRLTGNSAFNSGGGAYDSTLNNSLLVGNTALTNGGGSSYGTLNNCTLTDNGAGGSGGGSFTGRLNNCIVYFNTAPTGANYQASWLVSSCTTPDPGGTRNITDNPLFVNAGAGNYRLSTNSPCLDQGTNVYVNGATDLDGNPRIVNSTVDMGAYEYQGEGSAPAGYWAWASRITNGLSNYTDCATGDGYPNLLKYATGSSPTNTDDIARVSGTRSNGLPVLVFHRNTDVDDATLIVQGAHAISNGTIWSSLATNINGSWGGASNVTESGSGNPVTCYVQDVLPLLSNRFLRLKVTRP